MLNKYGKYIYSLIIFYIVWLVVIPLGFRFLTNPVLDMIKSNTEFNLSVKNLRLNTSVVPNIKIKADEIKLLNKDNSEAFYLENSKLSVRLLPLISGKVHINSFQSDNIRVSASLKDKLYIGDYPIELKQQDVSAKIKRVKVNKFDLKLSEPYKNNKYAVLGSNIYFKDARTSFIFHGKTESDFNGKKTYLSADINLPHRKNLKKTKFNIDVKNLYLSPFSDIINTCVCDEITSLDGVINLHSNNKTLYGKFDGLNVLYKDNTKSIIFPSTLETTANYKIKENSVRVKEFLVKSPNVNAKVSGSIKDIFSLNPDVKLTVDMEKSDIRAGALMLPPVVTPDISIPKLKEYPFYGNISGSMKIKGKFPEPDIYGNVKVTDGVLIKPIPNTTEGANINIDFTGKQLLLDVVVPAGGREIVYVSGDIMLYGDRFAHLRIRSSKFVDLNVTEHVVNPLHEIFCFVVGPVPIMDVEGHGNIDIKIVGTKKDPHIWGDFNFIDSSARFLEVNNLVLEHATGNLNFNNQDAHFVNNTGTLHGQPAKIEGVCTLLGNLDFNVNADNQELNDLVISLTTSPMLKDIGTMVPKMSDIKGKADFYLNLKGKLQKIEDLKLNENVFPSGYIKLKNNSLKLDAVPVSRLSGVINYNKTDCDFDLKGMITSASESTIKGVIKDKIADVKIDSPRIFVNELDPVNLRYLDALFIRMKAHYKGKLDEIELGGVDADIEVIKDNKPVRNGKILSGRLQLKNSNLKISALKGIIRQNPFDLELNARSIGKQKLDLSKAVISGDFNCKSFDLTILNLIAKANILPNEIQKELNKIAVKSGIATITARARNNILTGMNGSLNAKVYFRDVVFDYLLSDTKDNISSTIKVLGGNIDVKNRTMNLNKINCLVDNMPVFIFGKVNDFYKNPQYDIHLNSKLVQRVFDKYWNANNIYPVKINGDILCSSQIIGNKNHNRIKADIKMEENSNIYYMGATIGDSLNPITVNVDADVEKNGWIKLNKFKYNKIISSQNNRNNVLPLLSIYGQLRSAGKVYELKNLCIKTDNPANANFFNIIFKKPTIKSGNFTSDIKINGYSNRPKIVGQFKANNLEMPYLNTSVKDVVVGFKPDTIQVTTNGTVLENYMMVHANIKNNFSPPYKINSADIYINELDMDNSLNQLKQIELKGFSSAIAPDADTAGDIINSLIFSNVKLRAGKVKVKNINASNLEAVCSLNDRMQVAIESFKFNMASGIINGKISYNLLNNFTQMELNSKDVNANELIIALFDLPNQIYGSLTGRIELSFNATNDKTRLNTLSGFGSFKVANGKMPKLGSLEYLLRAGNLIKGGITGLTMNGIIDVVTPMKTGEFSSIDGRIRLQDGIAKTVEIRSIGKGLSLYLIGSINLSNQIADMHVYGQLSRKISTILGTAGNISLNTLFNKIPGISLNENNQLLNDINKIPGIEISNKSHRRFMVEILGDIGGENFVKSFKWIN